VDPDAALAELAAWQHGVVDRLDAERHGLTPGAIQWRLDAGRLRLAHPGVYVFPGAPETWQQRLFAACRAAGRDAFASHRAAGQLWGLLEEEDYLELSVTRSKGPVPVGALVHRSTDLVPEHCTIRMGIPVTNPLRTMVDLGAVVPWTVVSDALERGLVARLFSVPAVEWFLVRIARQGRRGCGPLRRVLDDRALGVARPDGLLEPRMARLIRRYGLPEPAFQHVVPEARARLDFAYPERRLGIEVDGFEFHGTREAMTLDLERQNRLMAAGWRLVRFTWHDVVRRPGHVAATLSWVLGGSERS
jgi:very-short-patch-repair endonuclease